MDAVASIGFWAAAFVGVHLVVTSSSVRPRLVRALGEQPYRGIFSLLAIGTFVPLVWVYAYNKHAGPLLWNLRDVPGVRWLSWLMMFAAVIILIAGFMTPSPVSIGAPPDAKPRGILKVTRHPAFVAFALFGFAHMLMNGFAGDVVFFATFPALAILGGWHQDRRKLAELGEPYRRFVDQTSFFPGLALIQRRLTLESADVPWTAVGVGAALTIALVVLHPYLFGGQPLG
jgi:uncharacterized membrane protein